MWVDAEDRPLLAAAGWQSEAKSYILKTLYIRSCHSHSCGNADAPSALLLSLVNQHQQIPFFFFSHSTLGRRDNT